MGRQVSVLDIFSFDSAFLKLNDSCLNKFQAESKVNLSVKERVN